MRSGQVEAVAGQLRGEFGPVSAQPETVGGEDQGAPGVVVGELGEDLQLRRREPTAGQGHLDQVDGFVSGRHGLQARRRRSARPARP